MDKIISPLGFPLLLFGIFWFMERDKSPKHRVDRAKMRFWIAICGLMACGEYAEVWHKEIGSAWLNYPNLALFSTLAVFTVLLVVAGPLPDFTKKF